MEGKLANNIIMIVLGLRLIYRLQFRDYSCFTFIVMSVSLLQARCETRALFKKIAGPKVAKFIWNALVRKKNIQYH